MYRPALTQVLTVVASLVVGIAIGSKWSSTDSSERRIQAQSDAVRVLKSTTVDLEPQLSNTRILKVPVSYQPVYKKIVHNGNATLIPQKGRAIFEVAARETALVLVDTWDEGSQEPSPYMKKVSELLSFCRQAGAVIIHAPNHPVVDKYPQYHALRKTVEDYIAKNPRKIQPIFLSWPSTRNELFLKAQDLKVEGLQVQDEVYPGIMSGQTDISRFLKPQDDEYVLVSNEEYRFVLWKKQVRLVLYAGGATNACLMNRPTGFLSLAGRDDTRTGFIIAVVEDCTNPNAGANADGKTTQKVMMDYFANVAFVTGLNELKSANP